jgi:hypothetical protein
LLAGFGDAERTDGVAHPGRAVGSRNHVRTRLRQAHAQVACAKRNKPPRRQGRCRPVPSSRTARELCGPPAVRLALARNPRIGPNRAAPVLLPVVCAVFSETQRC